MMRITLAAAVLTIATGAMACCNPHPPNVGSGKGVIAQKQPIHGNQHKRDTVCLGKLCYKPFHGIFKR